jgi:hypothetical protein
LFLLLVITLCRLSQLSLPTHKQELKAWESAVSAFFTSVNAEIPRGTPAEVLWQQQHNKELTSFCR